MRAASRASDASTVESISLCSTWNHDALAAPASSSRSRFVISVDASGGTMWSAPVWYHCLALKVTQR